MGVYEAWGKDVVCGIDDSEISWKSRIRGDTREYGFDNVVFYENGVITKNFDRVGGIVPSDDRAA